MNSSAMPLPFPSDTASKPISLTEPRTPRRSLLIVDDEEGPRKSLRVVFKDEYEVLLAASGPQALELIRDRTVDVAVLDIRMSGMSGTELLQRLKEIDPAIEVVMLTAFETVETAREALHLGARGYLNKPFDVATIRAAVASAMTQRSLSEEIQLNSQKLRELQEELHHQTMREEIAQTKGDIYASVIHDISNPLTVISGFIEIINRKLSDGDKQEPKTMPPILDDLARITRQVNKCIEISHRYLGFIRQHSAETSRVSANLILDEVGEMLKFHPNARSNQVTIFRLREDVQVPINGIDLIQILVNLSANALQCSDQPHTVEIFGECVAQPLDMASFCDDAENRLINRQGFNATVPLLALKVKDNGPGIPPEIIARMFGSYFTTKSAGQGTGLGLAIILRFVKEAKGAVHVQTKLGQGTTFTVYLPIV